MSYRAQRNNIVVILTWIRWFNNVCIGVPLCTIGPGHVKRTERRLHKMKYHRCRSVLVHAETPGRPCTSRLKHVGFAEACAFGLGYLTDFVYRTHQTLKG